MATFTKSEGKQLITEATETAGMLVSKRAEQKKFEDFVAGAEARIKRASETNKNWKLLEKRSFVTDSGIKGVALRYTTKAPGFWSRMKVPPGPLAIHESYYFPTSGNAVIDLEGHGSEKDFPLAKKAIETSAKSLQILSR